MESLKKAVEKILHQLSNKVSIYTTVIVIFTFQFLFDKNFKCTCTGDQRACWAYMILPIALIFVLLLWMDRAFNRVCNFTLRTWTCRCCCNCHFCSVLCGRMFSALLVSLLWPVAVLLDADWFVCCYHQISFHEVKPCNSNTDLQQNLKEIVQLKTTSMMHGLCLLTVIIGVALFKKLGKLSKCCSSPAVITGEMLLEEGENLAREKLRETVKCKVNEQINVYVESEWKNCFNVGEELVQRLLSQPASPGRCKLSSFFNSQRQRLLHPERSSNEAPQSGGGQSSDPAADPNQPSSD
ncbi:uncharacterized protein LOC113166862 isoform X2 [Anabas testudineus]|uniref:uncharacterized protein LOC113166862 isoform X2 n=1 Tax=Anabas testudineus TaxID=64144 RepID=UPI000E4618A9|nr:uncharacterized protein LOC113166862 isoform X2 [Anabas testudineus]